MGDYKDTRGAAVVAPGSGGKRKRMLVDDNDNGYLEDYYFYDSLGTRKNVRSIVNPPFEIIDTVGATLSLNVPISMIKGVNGLTLPDGAYVGQEKYLVVTSGATSAAVVATIKLLGDTAPLTLGDGVNGFGSAVRLIWIDDETSNGWVVFGTSIRQKVGSLIGNATFDVTTAGP